MQIDSKINISRYKGVKDKVGLFMSVTDALECIRTGADPCGKKWPNTDLQTSIAVISNTKDKSKRNALKQKLTAVTWSGVFTTRAKGNLVKHSGIICMDLDELPDAQKLASTLTALPQIYAMFVSPSGNGLKLLFRIDIETESHEGYFRAIADWLLHHTKLEADESGKDVSRLCFLSYDPHVYVNADAPVLVPNDLRTGDGKAVKLKSKPVKQQRAAPATQAAENAFDEIYAFTNKIKNYEPGSYNDFVNTFVRNCKLRGIDEADTKAECLMRFSDYEEKLMLPIIKSVYGNNTIVFGKYKRETKQNAGSGLRSTKELHNQDAKPSEYNEVIRFWYEIEKPDKDTGEMRREVKFDHDKITFFLNNNGFKRMEVGETYQFVQIKDNQLKPVKPEEITAYVYKYLSRNLKPDADGNYTDVEDELYEVRKMFKRGAKTYCNEKTFIALPLFKPNFIRDDENTAYMYFNNGFVEITKKGIVKKEYSELKGQIWQKQIIPRDFTMLKEDEYDDCVFAQFLGLAVVGKKAEHDQNDAKKFMSAVTGIGYLLHRFKDSTNAKSVVCVDKKLRESSDSNGGSGKSLYFKSIAQVLHTCIINGKAFKFDSQYPFGTLQVDHGLAVFNDVKKNFDFEELFHYITEDWDIKRLYENPIVIPFDDSAKIGVATNFTLKGNGDSFFRRQHIIEFSNYFNANHDPLKEFKHRFFRDWDKEQYKGEWNRFYNFMTACIQQFLERKLVPFPLENYDANKLIDAMGEDEFDWLNDNVSEEPGSPFGLNMQIDKAAMFKKFKEDFPHKEKFLKPNTFTGWVKQWAKINGLQINAHKNGGRDKSNLIDFWTFTKTESKHA